MHDLMEMRFIAIEVALGHGTKATILSKTLEFLEASFKAKGYFPDLVRWYISDVIPMPVNVWGAYFQWHEGISWQDALKDVQAEKQQRDRQQP